MRGHSLLEILLVLALIGIIAFVAIPGLHTLFLKHKANTQINQLVRALNFARNLAIIENKSVLLCPANPTKQCGNDWQQGIDIYLLTAKGNQIIKKIPEFTGAKLSWNRKANTIVFAANGALNSQNGRFDYALFPEQAFNKHVILSSTGRIRVD